MEELVLCHFDKPTAVDALSATARIWATLGKIDGFHEEQSIYRTSGTGPMPLMRFGGLVFAHSHILGFLKKRLETSLYQELCLSRLHPATVHAMWLDPDTPKDFFSPEVPFLVRLLTLPYTKMSFAVEKLKIQGYLELQHHIASAREALITADDVHRKLSERLGAKRFFFSKDARRDYPRSLDIVVYAYLLEEVTNIPGHAQLRQSLAKYANLLAFFRRMEAAVAAQKRVITGVAPEEERAIRLDQESFPPKLYVSPEVYSPDFYASLKANPQSVQAFPAKPQPCSPSSAKEAYLGGSSLIVLLFLYFRS